MTLRFNKLSYFKQWQKQNIGWLHALFLLPTSFESNIFNVKQEFTLKKLHWKIKVQKAWIWVFNKFVHFICFEYTRLISWDSFFFFFTFEIQKQQSYQINNQHWIYMTLHIHDTSFKSCQFDVVSITCLAKNCKINLFPE